MLTVVRTSMQWEVLGRNDTSMHPPPPPSKQPLLEVDKRSIVVGLAADVSLVSLLGGVSPPSPSWSRRSTPTWGVHACRRPWKGIWRCKIPVPAFQTACPPVESWTTGSLSWGRMSPPFGSSSPLDCHITRKKKNIWLKEAQAHFTKPPPPP